MNLTEIVNRDLKLAMKAKDAVSLRGIRAIKAAILIAQTEGRGKNLDIGKEIKLLQKLVKQRKDSLEIYKKQNRDDLAKIEQEEIEVIEKYLPSQMSEEELTRELKNVIRELGAASMRDMGSVMAEASKKFAGKADGRMIASIVKNILTT